MDTILRTDQVGNAVDCIDAQVRVAWPRLPAIADWMRVGVEFSHHGATLDDRWLAQVDECSSAWIGPDHFDFTR